MLLSHPDISDAAVIGVSAGGTSSKDSLTKAGEEGTESPRAYIVLKPGSRMEERELQSYMRTRLAGYKQLVGGVRFGHLHPIRGVSAPVRRAWPGA